MSHISIYSILVYLSSPISPVDLSFHIRSPKTLFCSLLPSFLSLKETRGEEMDLQHASSKKLCPHPESHLPRFIAS